MRERDSAVEKGSGVSARIGLPGEAFLKSATVALLALALCAAGALGDDAATQPAEQTGDGPSFTVTEFVIGFADKHPDLPSPEAVATLTVTLGKTEDGYVAPRPGVATETFRLADVPKLPLHTFYATALVRINAAIVECFNDKGLIGIYVAPHPEDIEEKVVDRQVVLRDLRAGQRTGLRLQVYAGMASEVRTIASGNRVTTGEKVSNPAHASILDFSPVKKGDLLWRKKVSDYAYQLSRHPGRQVDVALSSAGKWQEVTLDYLVAEGKPWVAYYQLSNTGTKQTGRWRQRFGFLHHQCTGNDDIFRAEYTTSDFEKTHGVVLSYEAPLLRSRWLRWKIEGLFSEYAASDVGFAKDTFTGETMEIGGELIANIYQRERLFVDLLVGVRAQNLEVENELFDANGEACLLLPRIGLRLEEQKPTMKTYARVDLEWSQGDCTGADANQLELLGRELPDDDWVALKWDVSWSAYIEALLNPAKWKNPDPRQIRTLAHELVLACRGQYAFNDKRLLAQHEEVIGGLYSVRGYPESAVAGDCGIMWTAEYRLHLPRVTKVPYFDKPDWDLILKAFMDGGRTNTNDRIAGDEDDDDLLGTGLGIELQITRYLSLRLDWAMALTGANGDEVSSGHQALHFVTTISY